jgi:hypothetical protein
MSEPLSWHELSREQQKVLERLWAGGTVRGQDPTIVVGLVLMGYILGERLTAAGDGLCSHALAAMTARMRANKDQGRRIALARIADAIASTAG